MKVSLHIVEARRAQLASILASEGYLPLADVCSRLGVSEATARRDLSALAGENAITRTHGGALVEYNQRFPSFRERLADADDAKRRIAAAARRLITSGMTIWCDGGTTVYRLAEQLADDPVSGLVVVTNSLPVAEMLADREDCEVHLLGGRFFRRSSLLIGGHAAENVAAWRFDLAFLGAFGEVDRVLINGGGADLARAAFAASRCGLGAAFAGAGHQVKLVFRRAFE